MADRLVRLLDKDGDKIYPVYHLQDDYILWDEVEEDNQIIEDFVGATSSADGKHGLAPQPNAGDQNKVLYGDGNWRYAPGTVLAVTEWSSSFTVAQTNQTLTALTVSGYNQYGPLKGNDQNIKIVVPSGETWDVLFEVNAELHLNSYADMAWMGPGIIYTKDGGSEVKWASSIWTNRGTTGTDQYMTAKCARFGSLSAGTWIFKPAYVTGNITASNTYIFYGNAGSDYSRGPAYVMKATLVGIKK